MSQIRTRFAPSPTGYLHIGGVRTALFNWLFSRHHGGRFILRIDDTDRERNVQEALEPILEGFRWLGLDWDEGPEVGGEAGPYYQSQKLDRYQEAVDKLLAANLAYHDYATPEELQTEREASRKEGRRFTYSRRWMATDPAARERLAAEGRKGVVRLMMPREGECRFTDMVRGEVAFEWAGEQDHVIQRADGTCLYHLASVVDDHDMAISHVIRAEEHLSNTARQIFIAQGLGFEPPRFAHLPAVAEPGSRTKLSKRKLDKYLKNPEFARLNERGRNIAAAIGLATAEETFNPVIVDFYEKIGFLPEALVNYLLLLGWSLDDRTEFFSRDDMVNSFSLERVNKAPASFDPVKLLAFQGHYMQSLDDDQRTAMVLPFLAGAGLVPEAPDALMRNRVGAVARAAGDRLVLAGDILDYPEFFQDDGLFAHDEKVLDKRLRRAEGAADLLERFRSSLSSLADWEVPALEACLKDFVAMEEIKIGAIIHAVRVAITGKGVGFGLYEAMIILGRDSCLARIDRALTTVRQEAS
jgi:glutamyl-tRNA synthetase